MHYELDPKGFKSLYRVVGCLIEVGGEIILLHRKKYSNQGNAWGIPSGKIENKETPEEALVREIKEETNLDVSISIIKLVRFYKVRHKPGYDFFYDLFYAKLGKKAGVKINKKEHDKYKWVSPESALKLKLVPGTNICIKDFYKV